MRFSILQENLNKAVMSVARIISSRPQLPVLSNLLLKAQQGKLTIIGTDLSMSIGISVGGKIEEEGVATVPAKDFSSLISRLSADKIEISQAKGELVVRSGATRATFATIAASEFPDIEMIGKHGISIPLADFSSCMKRLLFASSQDSSRPILTGVKFNPGKKNELTLLATDGYRLSKILLQGADGDFGEPMVVPSKILSEVVHLALGDTILLQVSDSGGVKFSVENAWISGRLLAGNFPPAERIIPEKLEMEIVFGKKEFEQAIRIAAIFARESANIVKMKIEKGKMKIMANSPQIGENETEIEIEGPTVGGGSASSADAEIAFNSKYLLDWIGSVESERVEFGMVSSLKPGVFREQGNKNYTHVIMPVRVQKEDQR